jgi:hypothetical protein
MMAILFSVALITAIAAIVAAPLWANVEREATGALDLHRERLEREKTAALLAIREAEFDRAMGKLSEDDYAQLRGFYEQRALAALAALGSGKERSDSSER